jgi:hypothetical protein
MTQELIQAAKSVLMRSAGPMTISQIKTALSREMKTPTSARLTKEIGKAFPEDREIQAWPRFGNNAVYCSRPLSACVEEGLLRALDDEPLTVVKAGKAVKKMVPYVSEARALKEVRGLLPRLAASGRIVRLAANRQSVMYLSLTWMAKQVRADIADDPLASVIPAVVARLQSVSGTYVRIDHLRNAPELRTVVDKAILRLADSSDLVLARYDGPLPVAEDQKANYVEDGSGELFIGVALPLVSTVDA